MRRATFCVVFAVLTTLIGVPVLKCSNAEFKQIGLALFKYDDYSRPGAFDEFAFPADGGWDEEGGDFETLLWLLEDDFETLFWLPELQDELLWESN